MRWLIVLFVVPFLAGATLSGTIYGPDLGIIEQAIITIDGEVEQVVVVMNGSYTFDLDAGSYRITVESGELFDEQHITLPQSGSYIRDFILLPSLDIPDLPDVPEFSDAEAAEQEDRASDRWLVLFVFVLVLFLTLSTIVWLRRQKQASKYDAYEQAVIEALITHEGRATQKQIRALVPFSEAKVSLVLSDLAQKGVVRKFKQGRGNIVVLQDGSAEKSGKKEHEKTSGSGEETKQRESSQDHSRTVQADRSDHPLNPSDERSKREDDR